MPTMLSPRSQGPVSQCPWWVSYAVAAVASLVALILRELLGPVLQSATFLPFILAIVVSGWYGGCGPGLLATVLSVLTMGFRMPPLGNTLTFTSSKDAVALGLFGLAGLCISALAEQLHQARPRAES